MTTPDPCLNALRGAFPGYTWTRRTYRGVPTYTGAMPDGWALVKVREADRVIAAGFGGAR